MDSIPFEVCEAFFVNAGIFHTQCGAVVENELANYAGGIENYAQQATKNGV